VLRDPTIPQGIGQFGAMQAVAPSLGVELRPIDVRDASEIERAVTAFARSANGGLIVTGSALTALHRDLIITLAARHKLPAVYWERFFVTNGGLISYGADSNRPTPARGRIRRPHSQGRETGRPASAGTDEVRTCDQPEDSKGVGPVCAPVLAGPRRRGDRMRRREFIKIVGGAAAVWPLAAQAQESGHVYRLAFVVPSPRQGPATIAFFDELRRNGFIEGQNLAVVPDGFDADYGHLPELAAVLVKAAPDAIIAGPRVPCRRFRASLIPYP
jgi:hypothetical protein